MNFTTKTENQVEFEEIKQIKSGEISEYHVKIVFKEKASPSKYTISWEEPQIDMLGFWSSKCVTQYNLTPDWFPRKEESRTASGMPLITIYSGSGKNRLSVALSDPSSPSTISAGVVEENGTLIMKIDLFSKICSSIKEYEAIIRIDRREVPFFQAIKDARNWWSTLGYAPMYVPNEAKLPMYSTWYSFHQKTIPDEILYECKIAKEYGMDTVIVDDGWQTDDNRRGYAFCGDWEVCENKIPDMKKFVDDVHALGMKFMIWFSVPFVGLESKIYDKFKGMYLYMRKNACASVLDPRFKEVRDYLTDIYASSVQKYGWDGLKLDFIDSFELSDEESSRDFEKMDTVSVEEGLQLLLSETMEKLKKINPEIMIEFRQSYVGPAISKYGNIFRVGDCPADPINNRVGSLSLRLTSDTTAVHSDMIMWNNNDTNESVLYQLLGTMFAVPQISVRFDAITFDHKKLLKSYLSFWREHSDVILNGELKVYDPDASFSLAKSKKDGECVAVLYRGVVEKIENDVLEYVFNATGKNDIYIESEENRTYEIYDIFGEKYATGKIASGVNKIPAKNCEMVKII